jgi:hypothetical protein
VVDSAGHATAVGATTYPARQTIADQVFTAAGTCSFPSCRQPAHKCDLDHREPFDHADPRRGGLTEPSNLDPLCRNHHLLKTHTGWSAVRDPHDGLSLIWTSPTGHSYVNPPRQFRLPDEDHVVHDARRCDGECGGHRWPAEPSGNAIGSADEEHLADCFRPPRGAHSSPDADRYNLIRWLVREKEQERLRRERDAEAAGRLRTPPLIFTLGLSDGSAAEIPASDASTPASDASAPDDRRTYEDFAEGYEPPTDAFLQRFCSREVILGHATSRRRKELSGAHPAGSNTADPPF